MTQQCDKSANSLLLCVFVHDNKICIWNSLWSSRICFTVIEKQTLYFWALSFFSLSFAFLKTSCNAPCKIALCKRRKKVLLSKIGVISEYIKFLLTPQGKQTTSWLNQWSGPLQKRILHPAITSPHPMPFFSQQWTPVVLSQQDWYSSPPSANKALCHRFPVHRLCACQSLNCLSRCNSRMSQ